MIGLPLTSFPLITRLTGATVAPFSAIPIGLLGLVWFSFYVYKRGKLPRETVPFLVFILFVTALAALAFFEVEEYFRNRPLLDQTLRTFIPGGDWPGFLAGHLRLAARNARGCADRCSSSTAAASCCWCGRWRRR